MPFFKKTISLQFIRFFEKVLLSWWVEYNPRKERKFWPWNLLYMYFHQIEGAEFICNSHGQTFLSTLYELVERQIIHILYKWSSHNRNPLIHRSVLSETDLWSTNLLIYNPLKSTDLSSIYCVNNFESESLRTEYENSQAELQNVSSLLSVWMFVAQFYDTQR